MDRKPVVRDARKAFEVLLKLTAQLTEDRPLEEFLTAVTDASVELLTADHGSIRLLDTSRTSLLSGARSGSGTSQDDEDRPLEFQRGQGVLGWVVEHGEPARIDDVAHDSRWITLDHQRLRIASILAEPLWSSGEVIGVLSVTSPARAAFSEEDQLLLRLLANCSAPPIERARLRRLAMFDDLTMAFNHRYLQPRLVEEMERASRANGDVSVLYMDLDHFKRINDRFGHATGDVVLRAFADRVRKCVRRIDVLVRRGGEEFILIMPQTGATQALATATRIQQTLQQEPVQLDDGDASTRAASSRTTVQQTVSIGVATWDKRETPEALEARADAAMYRAKRLGRDRVVVATS